MALKPVKYIEIDDEKGQLYAAGKQNILIPVYFVVFLNDVLAELVGGSPAQILIYKIGQAIGESYAGILEEILKKEKVELTKDIFIRETYNAISMTAGWGKIEVKELDLKKEKMAIKITNSVSGQLLKNTQYNLERGILSGAFKKIIGKEVYFQADEDNRKKKSVIFNALKKIPKEFLIKEKMALLTRKELEEKIKETTKNLQNRIEELEHFHKLTVGRELRIIELKEELEKLKKESKKYKTEEV